MPYKDLQMRRDCQRRYKLSERGRATQKRYYESERGKQIKAAADLRWKNSRVGKEYLDSDKPRTAYKKWRASEKGRTYLRAWYKGAVRKIWEKNNPIRRIRINLRDRIRRAIKWKGIRASKTSDLLGCDPITLSIQLQCQFRSGMTWENYGKVWHVDHKSPCCAFDLTNPEQQKKCFHFSNLQPLFVEENLIKGGKPWLV